MTVQLEIPDHLLPQLVPTGHDPGRSILEDSVAEAYRERRLTMHQVGLLLGLETDMLVDQFLGARQIYDDYTVEDLNRDLEMLQKLRSEPAKAA